MQIFFIVYFSSVFRIEMYVLRILRYFPPDKPGDYLDTEVIFQYFYIHDTNEWYLLAILLINKLIASLGVAPHSDIKTASITNEI